MARSCFWTAVVLAGFLLVQVPSRLEAFPTPPAATAPASTPNPEPAAVADADAESVFNKAYPSGIPDLRTIEAQVQSMVQEAVACTVGIRVGGSSGSGVIITEDGYILTAGHVCGAANQDAVVILPDGREVKARTLGINAGIDSGMMKIVEEGKWPHAEMGKARGIRQGQWCVAIGHPGGYVPGRTPVVRMGRVLSCNDRSIRTDCTGVGGDSGGPLFNLDGQVIGIWSSIGTELTQNYHVPIATYHETWDRLAAGESWGGRRRPLLGVACDPNKTDVCEVTQVTPDSPAQEAGLKVGDLIQKIGGDAISKFADLVEKLSDKKAGDTVTMEVKRGEETLSLEVTLADFTAPPSEKKAEPKPEAPEAPEEKAPSSPLPPEPRED